MKKPFPPRSGAHSDASLRILDRQQRLDARREVQDHPEAGSLLALRLESYRQDVDVNSFGRILDVLDYPFRSPHLGRLFRQGQQLMQELVREGAEATGREQWLEEVRRLLEPVEAKPPPPFRDLSPAPACSPLVRPVDDRLFRSPQPFLQDLETLKGKGLSLVVNLREESEQSREYCDRLGLEYRHLPVPDQKVPGLEQVFTFLSWLGESRAGAALVHCWAGQGRTGVFVACYRLSRGTELEEAIRRTDEEARHRGMRAHQRAWVREIHPRLWNWCREQAQGGPDVPKT